MCSSTTINRTLYPTDTSHTTTAPDADLRASRFGIFHGDILCWTVALYPVLPVSRGRTDDGRQHGPTAPDKIMLGGQHTVSMHTVAPRDATLIVPKYIAQRGAMDAFSLYRLCGASMWLLVKNGSPFLHITSYAFLILSFHLKELRLSWTCLRQDRTCYAFMSYVEQKSVELGFSPSSLPGCTCLVDRESWDTQKEWAFSI